MTFARLVPMIAAGWIGMALLAPVQAADTKPGCDTRSRGRRRGRERRPASMQSGGCQERRSGRHHERVPGAPVRSAEPPSAKKVRRKGQAKLRSILKAMEQEKEKAQEQQALAAKGTRRSPTRRRA